MVLDSLLDQIRDIRVAARWAYPDAPGSAHVPDLTLRLTPEEFQSLRTTPEGVFLLELLESFVEALNDDWLPFELAGLPLPQARDFLGEIATHIREHRKLIPLEQVRSIYRELAAQVA